MPTENRSSNTETVSELLPCPFCGQQDFLIERLDSDASVVICQGLTGPHEACLARGPVGVAQDEGEEQPGHDKAVELWNARAEQHQGEPAVLPARKPEPTEESDVFTDAENSGFNTCLDEIAKQGPLYTHADPNLRWKAVADEQMQVIAGLREQLTSGDPGEVERLRAEIERMRERVTPTHKSLIEKHAELIKQRDTLRAQLAERDALLQEVAALIESGHLAARYSDIQRRVHTVRDRISALSASAEPEVKS